MKKEIGFLILLKQWTEAGKLPDNGLCNSLKDKNLEILKEFFEPTPEERIELKRNNLPYTYWGAGDEHIEGDENTYIERALGLTPLRQTLLCFCAVLNNEL